MKTLSTYQGWKNYETWNIALWLGNDEGTYREMVVLTRRATSAYELGQSIKEYVQENNPLVEASMYSDLLNSAISACDFLEIAEHYWNERE